MRELRCPGWHSADGSTRHSNWFRRGTRPSHEEYYCDSCEASYPYLVNVAAQPTERHSRGPAGPVHPKDPNDYGNPTARS